VTPVPRRSLHPALRYLLAAAAFGALVGLSRLSRPVLGFSVDTTSLIILSMIGSAWYLGRGPGLLVAAMLEAMLDYYAGWPKDPVRFGVIAFNRVVLFGSLVWFASARRAAEGQLREQQRALAEALERERRARTDAEAANRMKDDFLATVSHELRTPLNAMLGWASILNRHDVDAQTFKQAADAIQRSAHAQAQIVGDILDTSRIVTGQLRLEHEPCDLGAVVSEAVETVRVAAAAKNLSLDVARDPELIVLGDGGRLRQIAWNLLANAIKFTPAGGSVRVRTARSGEWVELVVEDSGEGIDPAFLPRLFDRFSQADSSMTREHGGLGLGLAIVRHLVELHGGTVTAHSAGRGAGSRFVVRLRAQPVQDAAAIGRPGVRTQASGAPP
jgi:signal transduction histidine kinase